MSGGSKIDVLPRIASEDGVENKVAIDAIVGSVGGVRSVQIHTLIWGGLAVGAIAIVLVIVWHYAKEYHKRQQTPDDKKTGGAAAAGAGAGTGTSAAGSDPPKKVTTIISTSALPATPAVSKELLNKYARKPPKPVPAAANFAAAQRANMQRDVGNQEDNVKQPEPEDDDGGDDERPEDADRGDLKAQMMREAAAERTENEAAAAAVVAAGVVPPIDKPAVGGGGCTHILSSGKNAGKSCGKKAAPGSTRCKAH
jgi:hypothetical protein